MSTESLFEDQKRREKLEMLGDPLKKLSELMDFEIYRQELEKMYNSGKGKGGRPPYDPVKMFKILIIQRLYGLSDSQTEFQINDRRSFQRFIGVSEYESLPDEKTIWVFRERIKESGLEKVLFSKLLYWIRKLGFSLNEGMIVDATITSVPVQRNTKEENDEIKKDTVPDGWEKEENMRKTAQKDMDARWTKKHGKSYYGYKNHIAADRKTKIIRDFEVTDASVHDSQMYEELLQAAEKDETVFGDSAYSGEDLKMKTEKQDSFPLMCRKGCRNRALTEIEKQWNRIISKVRSRVEHIFADIKSFGAGRIRTIGMDRARVQIALANIVYNMRRISFLLRSK